MYLNITGGANKSKLILEMVQGFHTQNLVSEIFRLSEDNNRANLHFEWVDKYLPQGKHPYLLHVLSSEAKSIFLVKSLGRNKKMRGKCCTSLFFREIEMSFFKQKNNPFRFDEFYFGHLNSKFIIKVLSS